MSISQAQALRRQRAELAEKAGAIVTRCEEAGRAMTTEERTEWKGYHDECATLLSRAEDLERQADLTSSLEDGSTPETRSSNEPNTDPAGMRSVARETDLQAAAEGDPEAMRQERDAASRQYGQAFEAWMRYGPQGLTERATGILARNRVDVDQEQRNVVVSELMAAGMVRAQATNVPTAGGHMVPDDLMRPIVSAAKAWGGMLAASNLIQTATGRDLPIPTDDDVANEAEIVGQNQEHDEQDIALNQVVLGAHMYSSKFVRCPIQFLEDANQDVNSWVGNKLGIRMGRGQNRDATTGDGSDKPHGFVEACPVGHTTASASAFTRTELLTLKHSVDPAHRLNARWMFNDNTLLSAKLLVDGNGRPLWQAGLTAREPDTLDGDPYQVNQHMANIGSSAKFLGYGDYSYYYVRQVRSTTLLRLTERFAEFGQVGFLLFQRMDAKMVDPGSNPIQLLQAAA